MTGKYLKVKYDLVAAIDIGTSLSGYAYSTTSTFSKTPLNITSEQCWNKLGLGKDETEKKHHLVSFLIRNRILCHLDMMLSIDLRSCKLKKKKEIMLSFKTLRCVYMNKR